MCYQWDNLALLRGAFEDSHVPLGKPACFSSQPVCACESIIFAEKQEHDVTDWDAQHANIRF